ncbi:MAG: MATE family efflux transporter [Symbiobacteriaceae bacterium]|nr:MATE family efflux transporter [Symbiobacteriaceae bacterium]
MRDFTQGNIIRHIAAFAVPMLIGTIFQQLYNMVDAAVVGVYVSSAALAAVGTAAPILNILNPILIGLTNGASVLIAQYFGAKAEDELSRVVSTAMVALGAAIALITCIGFLGASTFLRWLQVPVDILGDATTYLRITMGGLVFMMFYNLYTSFLRALGDSRTPLYILIFSSLLNVVLDLIFVIVGGWGVAGVAWATLISQAVATLACFMYANRQVPEFRIQRLVFDTTIFRYILTYGIPNAIQLSLTSFAHLTIQHLINGFGAIAIAGITAATRIDSLAYMPLSAISTAIGTMVAQNMGAANEERAKEIFRTATLLMLALSLGLSTIIWLWGGSLINLFLSAREEGVEMVREIGSNYLSILAFFFSLFAIFFGYNGFFRGAGDNVIVMCLTIFSLTLRAVTANILVSRFGFGPEAVAWSIPVGWSSASVIAAIYYQKRMWAGKVVIRPKSAS